MDLPTLHRNALHGLIVRDQHAYAAFQRDHVAPLQAEWLEVLGAIEGALGLTPGSIGATHTLDLASMTVAPMVVEPVAPDAGGITPAGDGIAP